MTYDEWREKTGHDDRDQNREPAQLRATVHSDVIVPGLQALLVGGAAGLIAGTVALAIGTDGSFWQTMLNSAKWAGGSLVVGWSVTVIAFVTQHRAAVIAPIDRIRAQTAYLFRAVNPEPQRPPPLIYRPLGGQRGPALLPDLVIEHEAQTIEPPASDEIRDLYRFVCTMWPRGDVTRRGCEQAGFGRPVWEKYISGDPSQAGQESGRGLLHRVGAVDLIGGKWVIVAPLDQVLASNRELYEYASAKARLVRIGRDGMGWDGKGQVNVPDGPSQAGGGE